MPNITKQLNNLKNIQASDSFKKENRNILLNQIYSGNKDASEVSFNWLETITKKIPLDMFKSVPHSAFVGAFVLVLLFTSGFFGMRVAENAKPGDPLYIAKIAGEKTQLVFTFDEKKKVGLGLKFAGNRAKEISLVLNESKDEGKKEETVSQLVGNFKKEISGLRTRIEKINKNVKNTENTEKIKNTENIPDSKENNLEEKNTEVFSANLGREEKGIEVSTGDETGKAITEPEENNTAQQAPDQEEKVISEELDNKASSSPEEEGLESKDPEGIIDEAKELLEEDNYNEILTKMDEAEDAINNVNSEDVNNEAEIKIKEEATSTENVAELKEEEVASSSEE